MKKTMYMMRHGQTLFNEQKKIQGWCDSPLTDLGIRQAKGAKKYFEQQNIVFDHAYCSTSERCSDTLELITDLPYKRMKGLKEMHFGKFEGESEYLNPPLEMYDTFFSDFGGESRADIRKRIYQAGMDIMQEDNETVLVVSHGGACSHFLYHTLSPDDYQEQRKGGFTNCSIFKYEYEAGQFTFIDVIRPLPVEEKIK